MRSGALVILKPDCLRRNLTAELALAIASIGLSVDETRVRNLDDDLLGVIYRKIAKEYFYQDLVAFMKSGPCIALLVSGDDAVAKMNKFKHELRKRHQEYWLDLTDDDLRLWRANRHPNQTALNIKLVAANLIHVCDSQEESKEC